MSEKDALLERAREGVLSDEEFEKTMAGHVRTAAALQELPTNAAFKLLIEIMEDEITEWERRRDDSSLLLSSEVDGFKIALRREYINGIILGIRSTLTAPERFKRDLERAKEHRQAQKDLRAAQRGLNLVGPGGRRIKGDSAGEPASPVDTKPYN